jgi:hypothetical protein
MSDKEQTKADRKSTDKDQMKTENKLTEKDQTKVDDERPNYKDQLKTPGVDNKGFKF